MADNHVRHDKGTTLVPQDSAPANPTNGDQYYDSVLKKFQSREDGAWLNTIGAPVPFPERNRAINGGFDYAQRDPGPIALGTTPAYIALDRFLLSYSAGGGNSATAARIIDSPNSLTKFCMEFDSTMASDADDVGVVTQHRMESSMVRDLEDAAAASLKFFHKSEATAPTEVLITVQTADVEDDFSATTVVTSSRIVLVNDNTWREIKLENIIPTADFSNGVEVILSFDNQAAVSGKTRIGQMMFNKGATAEAAFTYAGETTQEELVFCERFYEKNFPLDETFLTSSDRISAPYSANSTDGFISIWFKTRKRVAGTLTVKDGPAGTLGNINTVASGSGTNVIRTISIQTTSEAFIRIKFPKNENTGDTSMLWAMDSEL